MCWCLAINLVLFLVLSLLCYAEHPTDPLQHFLYFPEHIPLYPIRIDVHTKQPVTRGHVPVHFLSSRNYTHSTTSPKLGFRQMRRHFQCAPDEPGINGNNGAMSLLRYMPPTKEVMELMCTWAETHCSPWTNCQERLKDFKEGKFSEEFGMYQFDGFSFFYLLRIKHGKVYWGWPWGKARIKSPYNICPNSLMLFDIVDALNDLPELVTFVGGERAFLPMKFPFPAISNAPRLGYNEIPWPFFEGYRDEKVLAMKAHAAKIDLKNVTEVEKMVGQKPWHEKINKAAFFAKFDDERQLMLNIAKLRRDLFEVSTMFENKVNPLNPLSPEKEKKRGEVDVNKIDESLPFGYAMPLFKLPVEVRYNSTDYKYVVVPQGSHGMSSSGRIFSILARSRSVVLLVGGAASNHITARLRPWVHYVPLSQSGAEVAEVVEWLQAHDNMARQIAENGYNFGQSYLRLEDYYCYGATVLHAIGTVERNSSVLADFEMEEVSVVTNDIAYQLNH